MNHTKQTTVVTTEVEVYLRTQDLLTLCKEIIPSDVVEVNFRVDIPGGGDFSNMPFSINDEYPLVITYKTKTRSVE